MAHPKRRTSKHRKNIRRSHLALTPTALTPCPRCDASKKAHRVCDNCGYYGFEKGGNKGEEILQKEEF
jgi:large subunit ribosomal protein L32